MEYSIQSSNEIYLLTLKKELTKYPVLYIYIYIYIYYYYY